MDRIDFRSDTVTWPTAAMREAMATAQVGDDVYGEDPTVNELEALASHMTGMEAGLFVASGTMGNLVAILSHANRGDEAIVGQDAHIFLWETGNMAAVGGITPFPLPMDAIGRLDPAAVEAAVRDDDPHLPHTRLLLLENTVGGRQAYPLSPEYMASMATAARRHGLALHLDGARLFNAAVAQDINVREITRHVDSVSFCLSKGLCAPVGSVLCGSNAFIYRARRMRKSLGGGMRQAGILAAAGIVALTEMVDRLADDHARAQQLAHGLARIPDIIVDPAMVKTNMVFFSLSDNLEMNTSEVIGALREEAGVWIGGDGGRRIRAVTHHWISESDVQTLLSALADIISRA